MRAITLAVLLCTGCATQTRDWTSKDYALLGVAGALQVADGMQTEDALDNPHFYEVNPLFDKHPSERTIWCMKALGTAATWFWADQYPDTDLPFYFSIAIGGIVVGHNYGEGARP